MDLNKYYIFVNVYQAGNISKAAEALNISQPAISYSIKDLESQLGLPLFYRKHNGVEPTPEGQELYKYIYEALNTIILGENKIKEASDLGNGVIRIGIPSHIGMLFINKYIQKFNVLFPNIKFEIISKSSTAMIEMLEQKSLDIVIDNFSARQFNPRIKAKYLKTFNHCFVASKKYSEIFSGTPTISEITEKNMIVPNVGSYNRTELEKMLKMHNVIISPLIEVWTTEMMLDLVDRNIGVGYLIKDIIQRKKDCDKYAIYEFEDLPKLSIHMIYIQEYQSYSSRTFIDFIDDEIRVERDKSEK